MSIKEYVVSHIVNLIKIKSVLTLALTATFVVMALRGEIAPDQFIMIFTTVIAFYFGSQTKKEETPTTEDNTPTAETNTPTVEGNTPTIQYDAVYTPTEEEVSR